ncbi:MAG: gluconate 2-dehydrogenase subunit 3 family protein, partial [Ginsengibacter sp.]
TFDWNVGLIVGPSGAGKSSIARQVFGADYHPPMTWGGAGVVPDFIEFIVKDMPKHQVPMRGGLRWLDMQCLTRYKNPFADCNTQQQLEIIDAIAYPKKAKPAMKPGVAFFNLMRNLTATGFYTSEIGVKDVGYIGNAPNQWNGVPEEVLKQYNLAYTDKELKECVSF